MAQKNRFVITVDGIPEEEGHVRIDDFIRQLQLFSSAIKKYDQHITRQHESTTYLRIVDLHHSSPAMVVVEPRPYDVKYDNTELVAREFFSFLTEVSTPGTLIRSVDSSVLESLQNMSRGLGRRFSYLSISRENEVVVMDNRFEQRVSECLEPEESYPGFFRGILEAINIHGNANVFRIYPDIGPTKITCYFPLELRNAAIEAIAHFVEVRGVVKYKGRATFPHAITVNEIKVFPDDSQLPTLLDLRGVAPDATGDLLSEEFVRILRNATD